MRKLIALIVVAAGFVTGCADSSSRTTGVYMLVDASGTYAEELGKAKAITSYLLGTLQPGDSLALAKIETGSFSEKNIIAKVNFDKRPSVSNNQKRAFQKKVEDFVTMTKGSAYTDITGGVLQGVEFLNETGAGKKYILVFSDMKEDLAKGLVRDFPIRMDGITVIALNVTKLRSDNVDPREYMNRLEQWQKRVEKGGGKWKVINDLERIERILD